MRRVGSDWVIVQHTETKEIGEEEQNTKKKDYNLAGQTKSAEGAMHPKIDRRDKFSDSEGSKEHGDRAGRTD